MPGTKNVTGDPDSALAALKQIAKEFNAFFVDKGAVSEADTRANLIDKVLTQVLAWPERSIRREEHVDRGYVDYTVDVQARKYVAVEAKKEGFAFTLPATAHRTLKISGALSSDKAVADAIIQVRGYCDDAGIRYAIATNGYAWIIFRAIREDIPWREGNARVFPALEYIESHFTEFWNLLSFGSIESGSLDEEFGSSTRHPRQLLRVVDRLYNADLPLQRNRLHAQLHPLIQTIFQDIADQDPIEILQVCYVHTSSLRIVAQDLNMVITDAIPEFLRKQGIEPIEQGASDAGRFGTAIAKALTSHTGELYLLLGGIGSGKTTFIKRFQRTVGQSVLDAHSLWFHLDFLEAPLDPSSLELFAWRAVLDQLRRRYQDVNLETRRNIKKAFDDNIAAIAQTALRPTLTRAGAFDAALSPYLEKWQADVADYVPRILRVAQSDRGLHIVLFIDNVDQLSPAHQAQVFVLAQRVTRTVGSITVLALREESYYTANLQKTLTAYTSRKFHIASPHFRRMIANRIGFALNILENSQGPIDYVLPSGIAIDRKAIADFLRIIETSIFEHNRNIARFIEALCFGNMRLALDMFTMFMTSGATDVDKMLNIYRRSGAYFVPFHEFLKSIMLGERRYYKDQASSILNVFDCGTERNASHFTSLRMIRALLQRRGEMTVEGKGYVEIQELVNMSENVFDNREDVLRSLNRLCAQQLIEANTKSTESISGASHVRVTSAGWYYSSYLVKSFSYLDLVLQDTPLNDPVIEAMLREQVFQVDNLSDREDEKLTRMEVRFARVRNFLAYLQVEEGREQTEFDLERRGGLWAVPFVPVIRAQVGNETAWIEQRLRENRERFADDLNVGIDGEEASDIPVSESEEDPEGASDT